MKYLLLITALVVSLSGFSQHYSLSSLAMAEINMNPDNFNRSVGKLGASGRMTLGVVNSQININTDFHNGYYQVKTGIDLLSIGKKKAISPVSANLYIAFLDGKLGEGYRTPMEIELATRYRNYNISGSLLWTKYTGFYAEGKIYYDILGKRAKDGILDNRKLLGTGLCFFGGVVYGLREKYVQDRTLFERHFDVDPEGFWGRDSWKRKYRKVNGEYQTERKYEVKWFTSFSDFHHLSNIVSKGSIMGGTIILVTGRKYKWYEVLGQFGMAFAASSAGAYVGFSVLD